MPEDYLLTPRCFFIATPWNEGAISQQFRALSRVLAQRGHKVIILVGQTHKKIEVPKTCGQRFIIIRLI
jgi:hypothetical protein